jgi:hypothetical protein
MKGYGAISALDVFKFRLSLWKGGRTEANLYDLVVHLWRLKWNMRLINLFLFLLSNLRSNFQTTINLFVFMCKS